MTTPRFFATRRQFLKSLSLASAGALLPSSLPIIGCGDEGGSEKGRRFRYFAMISDTHIIDEYYEGPESNALDTESILKANERAEHAVEFLRSLEHRIEFVLHGGDLIHRYPFDDLEEYERNPTAIDTAAELMGRFSVPLLVSLGNHDYSTRSIDREFTHELFERKLGIPPYDYIDRWGWRFITTNCYLGATHDRHGDGFNYTFGSFGREQLEWLEALLQEGKPTFIVTHQPPDLLVKNEFEDLGFLELLRKYQETIVQVVTGHWHRWVSFDAFGPPILSMGATRYDEDSILIVEVDTELGTLRFVNEIGGFMSHETPTFDPEQADWKNY